MEGFFERLSLMDAFDIEEFRAAGAAHGTEIVGPRLADLMKHRQNARRHTTALCPHLSCARER
jgi:hypothetical protein